MPNGTRSWRSIRLALSTQPVQTRKTADSGTASSAAVRSRLLRPSATWRTLLSAVYTPSPPIQSSPLNVLRTPSESSSQVCSTSRCTAREKLRTATRTKRNPMMPRLVLVPDAGEKMSLTASAPPPVSS